MSGYTTTGELDNQRGVQHLVVAGMLATVIASCGGDTAQPTSPTVAPPPPTTTTAVQPVAGNYKRLEGLRISPGRVQFLFASAGRCINLQNSVINGVTYTTHTSKWQRRNSSTDTWTDIPGTERNGLCSYTPTESGKYRLVCDITIDGTRGKYRSENTISVD